MLHSITSHPALDNAFYRDWMAQRFGIEALELFARNYGVWVKSFPDALATLVRTTDDLEAKTEYVKTLHSEMGYGDPLKVHSVLLEQYHGKLCDGCCRLGRVMWKPVRKRRLNRTSRFKLCLGDPALL